MIVILVIVVIVVLGICLLFARRGTGKPLGVIELNAKTSTQPFAFPLITDRNGMPLAEFEVGNPPQKMVAVVDTASSDLILSLPGCDGCENPSVYNPELSSTSTELTDSCTRITFGTQKDFACWFKDRLRVRGRTLQDCSELRNTDFSEVDMVFDSVKFLGSHQRSESSYGLPKSDYNIIGLCNRREGMSFLKQISNGKFGIAFGHNPYIIIGAVPCKSMHSLRSLEDQEFYVAELKKITVNGARVPSMPRLIIDSGSNMLFCPDDLSQRLRQATAECAHNLNLELAKTDGSTFTLSIKPEHYSNKGELYIQSSNTPKNSIIIGTLLLQNTVIEFDAIDKAISIGYV